MTDKVITRRSALKLGAVGAGALGMPFINRTAFAAEPIKFGSLLDGTGALGLEGRRMIQTTEYAIDKLNAAGGLLGRQIKLIPFDTQSSMQLYTQYAQKLALEEKVDFIQGCITSASREAIRPILDRAKTLFFYATQYEGGVCDRNVFCTGTTPAQTVNHIVAHGLKTWGKKAYIIAADYNYGHITASWMTKFMRDGGGSVAGTDFFPLDVTNFSSAISRIQQASPDMVLSALVGANHSGFYRQWDAAGMKKKIPLGASVFGLGDELTTMDSSTTDGIVTCYGWYNDLDTPESKAFVSGMQAKYGADVTDLGELDTATYDGIMIWAEAVRKAGSVERDKVIAALDTGITVTTPSGKVTMDPATHHTIRTTYLAQPKNKKWDILETYPEQFPADTGGACDLIKNPKTNKQFVPKHLGYSMDLTGLLAFNVATAIATLVLITLGLGVIYGMMRIINLAHGEMMMLGAYTAVTATDRGVNIWIAMLVLPPLVVGLIGLILERTVIRFLYGRMMDTMLATWGLSLGIVGLVTTVYGNTILGVSSPVGSFTIGRYGASMFSLVIISTAIAVMVVLIVLLRLTKFGLILRATMQNPRMAAATGVTPGTIYMATFALGSALAGLAGGVLAPISGISPSMGAAYIARAFITVLGGGPAIVTGTGLASTLFGFIDELVSFKTSPVVGDVALLLTAVLLIRVWPQGITGRFFRRSL